tara:strand:+ start:211 stop:495 length:285 start_codon:yes stop_codon:yes gene_type:complete
MINNNIKENEMSYVSGMKIVVEAEPNLMNPEDLVNDMVKDGLTVTEAINHIVVDAIVTSKVHEMIEDTPELYAGEIEQLGNGKVEVTLESWDDV